MLFNYFFSLTFLSLLSFTIKANNSPSQQPANTQKTTLEKPAIQVQHEKKEDTIKENKTSIDNKKAALSETKANKKEQQEKEEKKQQEQHLPHKTITVNNNITSDMIAYKHWSGTHEPAFTLSVNGKKIEQGKQEKINVKEEKFEVRYDYSFANGFRKGATIVSCQLDQNARNVDITFSWDDEWRIKTKQAKPQKTENATYSA